MAASILIGDSGRFDCRRSAVGIEVIDREAGVKHLVEEA